MVQGSNRVTQSQPDSGATTSTGQWPTWDPEGRLATLSSRKQFFKNLLAGHTRRKYPSTKNCSKLERVVQKIPGNLAKSKDAAFGLTGPVHADAYFSFHGEFLLLWKCLNTFSEDFAAGVNFQGIFLVSLQLTRKSD